MDKQQLWKYESSVQAGNWLETSTSSRANKHGIVKVRFADLQRALYGMGNFELHEHLKRHYMQYYLYSSKTSDEKGQLFSRLLPDRHLSIHKVISSDGTLVIPAVGKLANKSGQKHRPKTVAAKAKRRF